ncbi:MAG TPA: PhnD/SsuA/transferrin family substrate-binding protein [Planctomycetota bacterium]|nr:PhnD/SsuA/transferrin family substrate-binding protein [Planctomycetota bacterium]
MKPLCLLAVAVPLAAALSAQPRTRIPSVVKLRFGVYASEKASEMYRSFAPVIEDLEELATKHYGRPVVIELRIDGTYEESMAAFLAGEVDVVRFGPASYVLAKERNPAITLLAAEEDDGDKLVRGVIFVRKDSPIRALSDLAGRTFAFGDESSTIGRYLVQAELVAAGITAKDLRGFAYLGRHDAVVKAVQVGQYDAGSAHVATFERMDHKRELRVLKSFDNLSKAWLARAGLAADVCAALRKAVLDLERPASLAALKVTGFQPAEDADFDFVRAGMKQARKFQPEPEPAPAPAPADGK